MITVHTEYQARFREITQVAGESFQLEQPLVSELAEQITQKYGTEMQALLIDPDTNDLNTNQRAIGFLLTIAWKTARRSSSWSGSPAAEAHLSHVADALRRAGLL